MQVLWGHLIQDWVIAQTKHPYKTITIHVLHQLHSLQRETQPAGEDYPHSFYRDANTKQYMIIKEQYYYSIKFQAMDGATQQILTICQSFNQSIEPLSKPGNNITYRILQCLLISTCIFSEVLQLLLFKTFEQITGQVRMQSFKPSNHPQKRMLFFQSASALSVYW